LVFLFLLRVLRLTCSPKLKRAWAAQRQASSRTKYIRLFVHLDPCDLIPAGNGICNVKFSLRRSTRQGYFSIAHKSMCGAKS
jgi:hypothetical protein